MGFSLLGLGLSYSVDGGNSSSSGVEEGKQLLFKDKVLFDKPAGGFSGVFRYALRADIGNGFPSALPAEALPFTGKTLPEGHDVNAVADRTPANLLEFDTDDFLHREDDGESSEDFSHGEIPEFQSDGIANLLVHNVTAAVLPETTADKEVRALSGAENATVYAFSGKLSREETVPKDNATQVLASTGAMGHIQEDRIIPAVKDLVAGMNRRWVQKETPGSIGEKLLPHAGVSTNSTPTPSVSQPVSIIPAPGTTVGETSHENRPVSSLWDNGSATVPIAGERTSKESNDSKISSSASGKGEREAVSSSGQTDWKHNRYNLMGSPSPVLQRTQTGQPATMQMGVEIDMAAAIPVGSGGLHIPQPMTGKISGEGERGQKSSDSEAGLNVSRDSLSPLQASRKIQPGLTLEPRATSTDAKNPPDSAAPFVPRAGLQDNLTAWAAGQVSVHGGPISENSGGGTVPKQVEISVPLGHMAWEQNLARQILQAGKKQLRQLHIKLNPSHLGSLEIKLHVDGDSANIAFSSQHAAVREAVEVSLPRLREMFAGSGINLGDVDVGGQDTPREGMPGGDSSPDRTYPVESNEEYHGTPEKLTRSRSTGVADSLLDYYA